MIPILIKNYFIFLNLLFIFLKLLNHKRVTLSQKIILSIFPVFLTGIYYMFKENFSEFSYVVPLLLIWFFMTFVTLKPQMTFSLTLISFGISHGLFTITSYISVLIMAPLYHNTSSPPYLLIMVVSVVLHTLLCIGIFRIKRFQKGMPFIFSSNIMSIATSLCLFLLALLIYIPSKRSIFFVRLLTPFLLIILLVFLMHWWQAQITKSYKQALLKRELESLRTELQEKDNLLSELSTRNEELGRLIHKDNKRIPAMEHAVCEYLVMDMDDKESAIERGNALLLEIRELSRDRDNTISEIYGRRYKHHDTGISTLDTMLNYMEKRAYSNHIKLSVNIALDLNSFIPKNISTEDLTHALSDLLENAIIATKTTTNPVIQLQFYESERQFVIEIADNGIPFEISSLVNFGLEQLTTHADTGGSGIGLMDIWKIKETYSASLHIAEYENDAPYTKKIALIFNKKNRYTISSPRKDEIIQHSKRTDLQIF